MNRNILAIVAACALALEGCASAPSSPSASVASSRDCASVAADAARLEETRRSAAERQDDAWKVVVPVAVVARYARGKAAVGDADRRLAELHAQAARQGCAAF